VTRGSVAIDGEETSRIGCGYVVLVGAREGDTPDDARYLAHRTVNLRVFPDAAGRMNRSIEDVGGELLVVSQFTLYADTRKGNRPSFIRAGDPAEAERLVDEYVAAAGRALGPERVKTGRFGAMMQVELVNDGPVTIEISTDHRSKC
jgi:D-tyrosyl-tRNA(Tyr) deacylase